MRGCKCTIWEGGCRAISLWRWPGRWQPRTVDHLTAHLDVLPTLCDLAGASIPEELQPKLEGFSLRPLLESEGHVTGHEDRMLFHHVARWPTGMAAAHKYAMCGVRQGHYLLLRSHPCDDPQCTPKVKGNQCQTLRNVASGATSATYTKENAQFHWGVSPTGRWVLFNVKEDPACRNDLTAAKPTLVANLAAAYDRWWDEVYPAMIQAGGDGDLPTARIEPSWESLAVNYQVPEWFVDGKIGVWMHWGIPSAAHENRPNDGSHYGRRMYSVVPDDYTGEMGMSETLTKWHTRW
jgi:arylsulfatase A-like enzyme